MLLAGLVLALVGLARGFEDRPELDRAFDVIVFHAVPEDAAHHRDFTSQRGESMLAREPLIKLLEIFRPQIIDVAVSSKRIDDQIRGAGVLEKTARRELAQIQ